MINLRNAPKSILLAGALLLLGASFNFIIGLFLALDPETLPGIEQPTSATGAPTQLVLLAGIACIAFGFVYLWIFKEIFNKSKIVIVLIYAISAINILFGLFRLPIGLLTIALNLLMIFLLRSKSARQWQAKS